eukprot:scaffold15878_cov67-Attheya_sp.AAC.2
MYYVILWTGPLQGLCYATDVCYRIRFHVASTNQKPLDPGWPVSQAPEMAPTSSAHKNTYATCRLYTTVYDTRAARTKHCNGSVVAHAIVTASLSRDAVRK